MPTYHSVQRKSSLRLACHNYSFANIYFITLITRHRKNFLGKIIAHEMILSDLGKIIYEEWFAIPKYFPDIELDEFVVMPNHVHGIIKRKNLTREELNSISDPSRTKQHLSKIIRTYKSSCTRIIHRIHNENYFGWHKNYHDHIIRSEIELNNIRNYIRDNPFNWHEDEMYELAQT